MRIVSLLTWTAIILGVAGIFSGRMFHVPTGVHLGVFLIGAGLALGGLESLLTRRMSFRTFSDTSEQYAGAPAVIWGLMTLLGGVLTIRAAYLLHEGLWHATTAQFVRQPGPVFVVAGLLLAGAGALFTVQPNRRGGVWRTLFVRYPRTLIGVAVLSAGLLTAGTGAWEWIDPRGLDHYAQSQHGIDTRAMRGAWKNFIRNL